MTGTSEPTVALSFANNFWGKEDAGVGPMLQRMHDAKTTCEELKGFYTSRAAIEDEYARKLLALSKKPLGSTESGSLKTSLDVLRLEVESMAKAHQNIAGQFKTECEEQLSAFSGAMRERRKIVQGGIEKLLKLKMQQTQTVNKTRDRYEQDCLKIKGYIAQGHMVMGQEEKKNKTRLEKAQIALTGSSAEYEAAIKALQDTTGRWNRDWKQACDKFQDLEEERIDFLKASCWMFANIQSTVCVSDDASCEKMRIALEDCDIEKDIVAFITEKATSQEIPDAPKFMNFCRDYSDDEASEAAEENFTTAQFTRAGNPAHRASSPNPSMASSSATETRSKPSRSFTEPEPEQPIVKKERRRKDRDRSDRDGERRDSRDRRKKTIDGSTTPNDWVMVQPGTPSSKTRRDSQQQQRESTPTRSQRNREAIQITSHNEYPLDGMTMHCRPGHITSDGSSRSSPVQRPSSSQGGSDYSSPTTVSSNSDGSQQQVVTSPRDEDKQMKRKSGFFSGGSPFRRKSKGDKEQRQQQIQQQREMALQEQRLLEAQKQKEQAAVRARPSPNSRSTWSPATAQKNMVATQANNGAYGSSSGRMRQSQLMLGDERHDSPEPIDPHASVALNVGGNVFDVSRPDSSNNRPQKPQQEEDPTMDPIAEALAHLKGVTKNSVGRNSADRFFGLSTPAPSTTPRPGSAVAAAQRGTPPPTYAPKTSALDLPPPAFTSAQMQQTTQRYTAQRDNLLEGPPQMPAATSESPSRQGSGRQRSKTIDYQRPQSQNSRQMTPQEDLARSVSPIPNRSVSPRPQIYGEAAYRNNSPKPRNDYSRSASPNPYTQSRPGTSSSNKPGQYATYNGGSPGGQEIALSSQYRNSSPAPSHHSNASYGSRSRAGSVRDGYGSVNNRQSFHSGDPAGAVQMYQGGQGGQVSRPRSKSQADGRQFSRDGRPILHYARAMYQYQAAIPQELPFAKGDILAVLREQDDGWWEAEIVGVQGRPGLVPSNYLQTC